jgi:HD-GYP domain-containing protein (c-di-GMP phosphodiesterase class II)
MVNPSFELDIDQASVGLFCAEFNDTSIEIDVAISHLIENPEDNNIRIGLISRLQSLHDNAMSLSICPMAESIDVIIAIASSSDIHTEENAVYVTDIILLLMDKVATMLVDTIRDSSIPFEQFNAFQLVGKIMAEMTAKSLIEDYHRILHILDIDKNSDSHEGGAGFNNVFDIDDFEEVDLFEDESEPAKIEAPEPAPALVVEKKSETSKVNYEILEHDSAIFETISKMVDKKLFPNRERTVFLMEIAMAMNTERNNIVPFDQLLASIYLHDFGMLLLPESFFAQRKLSGDEFAILGKHPIESAELVKRGIGWEVATEIISQHHERPDGKGYPNKLMDGDICEGAKLLAISDAFCAMINPNHQQKQKKTFLRASAEINKNSGTQFSADWIPAFNTVVKRNTESKSHWLYPDD